MQLLGFQNGIEKFGKSVCFKNKFLFVYLIMANTALNIEINALPKALQEGVADL